MKLAQSHWNSDRIGGGGGGVTLFLQVRQLNDHSTLQMITSWASLPYIFHKKDVSFKKRRYFKYSAWFGYCYLCKHDHVKWCHMILWATLKCPAFLESTSNPMAFFSVHVNGTEEPVKWFSFNNCKVDATERHLSFGGPKPEDMTEENSAAVP